jgi:hypothetical protein
MSWEDSGTLERALEGAPPSSAWVGLFTITIKLYCFFLKSTQARDFSRSTRIVHCPGAVCAK